MSLIAWYPLNGDTKDYSGNGYHLNNVGASVSASGKIGSAYDFNGTSDYMYNADVSTYLHGKKEASIAMWVKKKSVQYGFIQLSGYDNANGNLYPYNTETNAYLDIFRTNRLGAIEMPYSTLEWHHFVVTQTGGTNGWKLYQNGELVYEAFADDKVATNYLQFEIGRNSDSRYANALFNDVRIYDHALSVKEIKEISKAKIVHYDFDTNNELIVPDKSGFKNHGYMNSGTKAIWSNDSRIGVGSYEFDATDRLIYAPVPSVPDITVSGWVKLNSNSTWMLLTKGSGGTSGAYYIYGDSSSNCKWSIFGSDGTRYDVTIGELEIGIWYNLVGTFNSKTGEMKAYKNGVLTGTTTNASLGSNSNTVFIGRHTSGYYTNGVIDDIRVYATCLSDEDVAQLYRNVASIDEKYNYISDSIIETKHSPLLYDYTVWEDGQSGSIGDLNTYSSNNRRAIGVDPWGREAVVWEGFSEDGSSNGSGIYGAPKPIDNTKLYRMSFWEKRVTNNAGASPRYYFGCNGYGSVDGVANIATGIATTNPYFFNSTSIPVDEWFLVVGHIFPKDYAGTSMHNDSGVYTINGGKIFQNNLEFKWLEETTTARSRTLSIYTPTIGGVIHHSLYPRFDLCDGTEPTIAELLAGHDSRNYNYIKGIGGKSNTPMSIRENSSYISEIFEVGMEIRYIRDSMNGSSVNTGNHWVEIEAYDVKGVNVALGKSSSNAMLTDGNTESSPYVSMGSGVQFVEVDLGDIYNITNLNIRHYYADRRTYYFVKTEVSKDGVSWITVFYSELDGRYTETPYGKTIPLRSDRFYIDKDSNMFVKEIKEGVV